MTPRVGAILLAFFFGGFGAQKFYMGQIGYGVACVLFCWTGIPALIAVYDIIVFLLTSDEDWEARYWRK